MARLTHERRHQQILDTAIQVFAKSGFRGTTTKQLAKAAGVSEATIFLHFPSKEALYEEILEELLQGQRSLTGLLEEAADAPLAEVAEHLSAAFMEQHRKGSDLVRLALFSALERRPLGRRIAAQHIGGPVKSLVRLIERAQARGEVRADLDPQMAARALDSVLIHQIIVRELLGKDHVTARDMQGYVDIWLRGVAPRKDEVE
jgi:AcrR family transcriptional regulator